MNEKSDFADWLSPMLVKELRQGMRSRLFVICFLLLQAALVLLAVIGLSASANQQDTSVISGFYWTVIGVPLLLIMPLSALNAISAERKANTLELMFLTRMTARRILLGKWFAISAQTILLVCTILPYSVLRYFQGGINVTSELTTIGSFLIGSILLSGIAVGMSPRSSRLVRALLIFGAFISLQWVPRFLFYRTMGAGSVVSGAGVEWGTYAALAWFGILVLLMMMEVGAASISPAAENHSTSRRLLGLLALVVFAIFVEDNLWGTPLSVCTAMVLAVLCAGALCESPRFTPSLYRPFVRFGAWGRLTGLLLYPGWPSAVFYSVFAVAAFLAVALFQIPGVLYTKWIVWAGVCVAGTLLFPAALLHVFFRRWRYPFATYLGIQAGLAMIVVVAASLQAFKVTDLRPIVAMIPTCGLLLSGTDVISDNNFNSNLVGISAVTAASFILLLIRMRQPWRRIRESERMAARLSPSLTTNAAGLATTA